MPSTGVWVKMVMGRKQMKIRMWRKRKWKKRQRRKKMRNQKWLSRHVKIVEKTSKMETNSHCANCVPKISSPVPPVIRPSTCSIFWPFMTATNPSKRTCWISRIRSVQMKSLFVISVTGRSKIEKASAPTIEPITTRDRFSATSASRRSSIIIAFTSTDATCTV